jgi:hypothetical protein
MRSDSDIRRDVEDELRWDPDIDPTDIAVNVNNGIVTLTGFVRSYMQKYQAETDAKRVAGVIGVVNDIEVRLLSVDESQTEIARDAIAQIKERAPLLVGSHRVIVNGGGSLEAKWVELSARTRGARYAALAHQGITGRSR